MGKTGRSYITQVPFPCDFLKNCSLSPNFWPENDIMQVALAIGLTVLYVGITLVLGGNPRYPIIGWFVAPAVVTIVVGFAAQGICALLPWPWINDRRYES